jgi:Divergent InlB B-repeat domain
MVRYVRDGGAAKAGRCSWRPARAWLGLAICASVFSLASVPSAQGAPDYPINTSRPTITGKLEVGQTLTANPGTWTDAGAPIVKYEYVWSRCEYEACVPITENETGQLVIPQELEGWPVVLTVIATDEQGKIGIAGSEETAIIAVTAPRYAVSEDVSGGGYLTGAADLQTSAVADMNLGCPGVCGANFPYISGTSIELVAHPDPGATFIGWGGACSGSAPTCSLTVSAATSVTATFTAAPLPPQPFPIPEEGRKADEPGEAGAATGAGAFGGEGALGQGEVLASSIRRLSARLLGLRAQRGHHLQATVACQQARACRLTLAVSSDLPVAQLVASRTITLAPGRRASISLALDQAGALLLAHRHRLPVSAHLMLREGGRSVAVGGARLTLT